jgi:AcrR family transcriptional regulator
MTQKKPKSTYHHGDLKNALIEVALEHIARVGAHGLSLREVARSAGVSHSAAYRHFANKESLLVAIAEQGFRELGDTLKSAVQGGADDPAAALRACGVAYVEFGVRHPEHLQIMFGGSIACPQDYPSLLAVSKEAYQVLAATVGEGLRKRRLRGSDERMVALTSWALVHGLSQLIAGGQLRTDTGRDPSPRDLALAAAALLHQGIGASATSPRKGRGGAVRAIQRKTVDAELVERRRRRP